MSEKQTNAKSIGELQPEAQESHTSLNEGQNRLIGHMCGQPCRVYRSGKVPLIVAMELLVHG